MADALKHAEPTLHEFSPLTERCRRCWLRRADALEHPEWECPGYDGGEEGGARVVRDYL